MYITHYNKFTLMPLVSSSSNEPISKASAAFTSPLGGIRGGVYFCRYTCCQSSPEKNGCSFNSSDLYYYNKNIHTNKIMIYIFI